MIYLLRRLRLEIWPFIVNSEAREWRHHSDKTQTNKLEWWIILKTFLTAKAGVPKTLVKQKLRLHSLCFPHNTLMLSLARNSVICILALRYSASRGDRISPFSSYLNLGHPPFFHLLSNTCSDFGSVGRKRKKAEKKEKKSGTRIPSTSP